MNTEKALGVLGLKQADLENLTPEQKNKLYKKQWLIKETMAYKSLKDPS